MNDVLHQSVRDILSSLAKVTCEKLCPEEAQRLLRTVEARYPDLRIRLLWQTESYDNSLHYDVIIRSGNDTISLSMCQQDTLPWPLRGVQRWTEANILQVNGVMLTMEDAVVLLDVLWNEIPLMERMIDACLVKEELENCPISLEDGELQSGMDALRRTHGLYTVEDTERWMRRRGTSHEQLEQLVAGNLTCAVLRKRIAARQLNSLLESRGNEFDVAYVAQVQLPDFAAASRLYTRVKDETVGFAAAMQEEFLTDARVRCAFTTLSRREALSNLEKLLFEAKPGDVVGPVHTGSSYSVGYLFDLRPAHYQTPSDPAAEQIFFERWLAERRGLAKVTWHWGTAPQPG